MLQSWISVIEKLNKQTKFILGISLLLLIAIIFYFFKQSKPETIAIEKGDFIESVFGLATIQSSDVYHLRVALPSLILKVYVEKGDSVQKGSNLVRFDSFGILKSPIQGVITNSYYEDGELVNPQSPIVTVMDLENKYLSVLLEERAAVKVKREQIVRIRFEALGDLAFIGKVKSVFPSDGQFEVRIELDEFPKELLPGMTADVAIEVKSKKDVLIVPNTLIHNGSIEIYKNGKRIQKKIEVGLSNTQKTEILSDELKEGDLVIIPGKN